MFLHSSDGSKQLVKVAGIQVHAAKGNGGGGSKQTWKAKRQAPGNRKSESVGGNERRGRGDGRRGPVKELSKQDLSTLDDAIQRTIGIARATAQAARKFAAQAEKDLAALAETVPPYWQVADAWNEVTATSCYSQLQVS
jgi:hypothetical protein